MIYTNCFFHSLPKQTALYSVVIETVNSIASRQVLIQLVETRELLKIENHVYTKQIEVLEHQLIRCQEDEAKLRGITSAQSCSVEELVKLVKENEKSLDLIRVSLH